MKNKIIYILLLVFLILIILMSVGFYFYQISSNKMITQKQRCPEDFPDTDAGSKEQLAAIDKWTNDFFDTHPNSNMEDWAQARLEFYKQNNCVKALQSYNDAKSGKANPATMDVINKALMEAINSTQYTSDLGFSFNYPNDMYRYHITKSDSKMLPDLPILTVFPKKSAQRSYGYVSRIFRSKTANIAKPAIT